MRIFTPSENHRLNELVSLVGALLTALISLSLLSYNPADASLNVAAPAPGASPARNWIGPVGAHGADLLFQVFGYAAFLLPVAVLLLSIRWFRNQAVESPVAKCSGLVLMILSFTALVTLLDFPAVRGAVPPGGLTGKLCAAGLLGAFNPVGAHLVSIGGMLIALFLTTPFTLSGTAAWLGGPAGYLGRWNARWKAWREAREKLRMQKKVERIHIAGRPPVPTQTSPSREQGRKTEEERKEAAEPEPPASPIFARQKQEPAAAPAAKTGPEPKIAQGRTAYRLPSPGMLRLAERGEKTNEEDLKACAHAIEQKCEEFGVEGHVTQINPGPVVTTFEFQPEAGIKYSRITGLAEDLCLALRAESILIERIPGKSTVGIEVPNHHRQTIALREVLESPEFVNSPSKLTMSLGKDLIGRIRATDLAQMPHILIAGATGTGKSVFINSLIMSMLYKATPDELKLVLVDPKRLELGLYEDIPHLFTPVVTDPKLAANVLRNATREMEKRLKLLAQRGVRNIEQYNRSFQKESLSLFDDAEGEEHRPLPYIVIVIDELADLMMVDTNGVEESITRLAQMARAVGIHLILATQRPSVDIITGLIKANFPARISFRVASKVDSRTILDANGSESLLGRGDMLFLPAGSSRLHRIHGPLVTEDEIVAVCDFWRAQAKAKYNEELLKAPKDDTASAEGGDADEEEVDDDLYQEAVRIVCEMGRASTSVLQRRLRIGYGRAARLIDLMEKDGIVGPAEGTKPREVLKKKDWMKEFDESFKE